MKNCKNLFLFTFVIVMMSGINLVAVEVKTDEIEEVKQYVICRNHKIVRTIRVECPQNDECKTIYNKDGADQVEGTNNRLMGGQKILGNIQSNLEKAQWKCNDVTANAKIDN